MSPTFQRRPLTLDKSMYYFPHAQALVSLPETRDRVFFYTIDIDRELERSEIDYLFVMSRAPLDVAAGGELDYQMVVKSKRGGVKCTLSSGPEGMNITPDGRVTWKAPSRPREKPEHVIVLVQDDSGQEIYHSFALRVVAASEVKEVAHRAESPTAGGDVTNQVRTWISADGKHKTEGTLLATEGDSVRLQRTDGQEITVPLDQLSRADRDFVAEVNRLQEQPKKPREDK